MHACSTNESSYINGVNQTLLTHDPVAVASEVQDIYHSMFPGAGRLFVPQAFGWIIDCFTGFFEEYQPVDTRYHDFEHTLQGTLCMARILYGRYCAGAKPALTQRYFELGLLAILLHDTGYLKKRDDTEGTGAKYTAVHVNRSMEFAARLLTKKKFSGEDIWAVQNMIRCTGVDAVLTAIPFQSEVEEATGLALGAADLVGQMAAEDYVEKLPALYAEFAEAAEARGKNEPQFFGGFSSADDLMGKTPLFWENHVREKLNRDFGGMHLFLNSPYPDGPNFYLDRIEANLQKLGAGGY
ncbi:MAG TPA: hypothetical protein VH280_11000 [Verrucomicrobiae bacterium]|jgi:hypothetical protein|nr:hypothetical protein [Verrucomicrobiae bacterium]